MIKKWTSLVLKKNVNLDRIKKTYNLFEKGKSTSFIIINTIKSINSYIDDTNNNEWLVCISIWDSSEILLVNKKHLNDLFDYGTFHKPLKDYFECFVDSIIDKIYRHNPDFSIIKIDKKNNRYIANLIYLSDSKIKNFKSLNYFDKNRKIYKNKIDWDKFKSTPENNNIERLKRYKNGIFISLSFLNMFINRKIYDEKIIDSFFEFHNLNKEMWDKNKNICPLENNQIKDWEKLKS